MLGVKTIKFGNGDMIQYAMPQDLFSNTFFGTLNHLMHGQVKFEDKNNNIVAKFTIGGMKKKPKDYFEGTIEV